MHTCTNCETEFTGKYCPTCSQKLNNGRIYFNDLWHDFMFYFLSLDSPLPKTLKELLLRPGKMVILYISGKRKMFYSPVKFFILSIAVYFIIVALFHFDPVYTETVARGQVPVQNYDANNMTRTMLFVSSNINKFIFLFVIILGLISRMFFRKAGFNLTEYITFGFFVIGMYMLVNIPIIIFSLKIPQLIFFRYLLLFYIVWALIQFTGRNNLFAVIKGFFTVVLSQIAYFILVWIIAYYIVRLTH